MGKLHLMVESLSEIAMTTMRTKRTLPRWCRQLPGNGKGQAQALVALKPHNLPWNIRPVELEFIALSMPIARKRSNNLELNIDRPRPRVMLNARANQTHMPMFLYKRVL